MKRRHFLPLLPIAAAAPGTVRAATASSASPPAPRTRYSVNAYSFNAKLRAGEMDLADLMEFAAGAGLDAVDLTGYYFSTYPPPPPDGELFALKKKALRLGLDISWAGVRNNFVDTDPQARAADRGHIRDWLTVSAKLGAPILRIFPGKGSHDGHSREEATAWLVEDLKACAVEAAKAGVLLGLQHHNDFLFTARQVVDVLERVDSPWLGLNLDIGSLRGADPYAEIEVLAPRADYWFIKSLVYRNGAGEPVDMKKIAGIVQRSGYSGYLSIEALGQEDPGAAVRTMLADLRAAFA